MNLFKKVIALFILIFALPLLFLLFLLIKLTSKGGFIFRQKRAGLKKKPFVMYKIRTMIDGAEKQKTKLRNMNEADGPVFKIRQDPRYTKVGKFLSHTGLDEIPQLLNVINGEMDFVGPRPLPLDEANRVPKKYERRFSILPGITSDWIIQGSHDLSFKEWMELDLDYLKKKTLLYDLGVLLETLVLILKFIKRRFNTPFFYKKINNQTQKRKIIR